MNSSRLRGITIAFTAIILSIGSGCTTRPTQRSWWQDHHSPTISDHRARTPPVLQRLPDSAKDKNVNTTIQTVSATDTNGPNDEPSSAVPSATIAKPSEQGQRVSLGSPLSGSYSQAELQLLAGGKGTSPRSVSRRSCGFG